MLRIMDDPELIWTKKAYHSRTATFFAGILSAVLLNAALARVNFCELA